MNRILTLALILCLLQSCDNKTASQKDESIDTSVQYSGALQQVMHGRMEGTIALKELENKPHLYALGAVENLQGEIQVFDGKPLLSKRTDEMVTLTESFDTSAALLVYTQVPEWQSVAVASMIRSQGQFEMFLIQEAKKAGIDVSKPFPFLLTGTVARLDWHIVNWDINNTQHTEENHLRYGLNGVLSNGDVEIIGFYSKDHQGVFTHMKENTHMHFKTDNVSLAGHVDRIFLGNNMILKLPKQ
ncbi:acetolactate decarboxylase [Altibacter sp.]|uniref:acetolactate decarboxylase n=1 Tax=Altibacter sp. TaxID=2024823 RepID=UPI00258FEBB7|nr:acetolactate decarboxylase [Altibacter sp.]MCW9036377.1 acetolactate decarboxylase [Altibacter sp.]